MHSPQELRDAFVAGLQSLDGVDGKAIHCLTEQAQLLASDANCIASVLRSAVLQEEDCSSQLAIVYVADSILEHVAPAFPLLRDAFLVHLVPALTTVLKNTRGTPQFRSRLFRTVSYWAIKGHMDSHQIDGVVSAMRSLLSSEELEDATKSRKTAAISATRKRTREHEHQVQVSGATDSPTLIDESKRQCVSPVVDDAASALSHLRAMLATPAAVTNTLTSPLSQSSPVSPPASPPLPVTTPDIRNILQGLSQSPHIQKLLADTCLSSAPAPVMFPQSQHCFVAPSQQQFSFPPPTSTSTSTSTYHQSHPQSHYSSPLPHTHHQLQYPSPPLPLPPVQYQPHYSSPPLVQHQPHYPPPSLPLPPVHHQPHYPPPPVQHQPHYPPPSLPLPPVHHQPHYPPPPVQHQPHNPSPSFPLPPVHHQHQYPCPVPPYHQSHYPSPHQYTVQQQSHSHAVAPAFNEEPMLVDQPTAEQLTCSAAVSALYFKPKFSCKSCGLRCKDDSQLREHLEMHYREYMFRRKQRSEPVHRSYYSANALLV